MLVTLRVICGVSSKGLSDGRCEVCCQPFHVVWSMLVQFGFPGLEFAFERDDWINRGLGRESPQASNRKIELLLTSNDSRKNQPASRPSPVSRVQIGPHVGRQSLSGGFNHVRSCPRCQRASKEPLYRSRGAVPPELGQPLGVACTEPPPFYFTLV